MEQGDDAARFGELRALLERVDDPNQKRDLMALLQSVHRDTPELYDERWLPYLHGVRDALPRPLATANSLPTSSAFSRPTRMAWGTTAPSRSRRPPPSAR